MVILVAIGIVKTIMAMELIGVNCNNLICIIL